MPVGATNFRGTGGIGATGAGGGDLAQIGRYWLGAMQQPRAAAASPQSQDAAYFAAMQAARHPQGPPQGAAGLDALAAGGAVPPMHPRSPMQARVLGGPPVPMSRPAAPPLPPEQQMAQQQPQPQPQQQPQQPPPGPGKRFGAGMLQYLGQALGQPGGMF
jgi:hypothetical protein